MKHVVISSQSLVFGSRPVVRIMLTGTFLVVGIMVLILIVSDLLIGNGYVLPRLIAALIGLSYLGIAAYLFHRGRVHVTASMLLVLYILLGITIQALWGLNAPVGVLVLGFSIILSGIMLGASSILWTTLAITLLMVVIQALTSATLLNQNTAALGVPSTFLDVVSYGTMFILFAVIAWVAGRRNEQLLQKSLSAEAALQKEKDMLSVRLEQKTREVREAQLIEMRRLYEFAELGQLGMVLLHDLANNLTALTLDIDDIGSRLQRNESITRAKESIAYLETMVNGVRRQIHERDKPALFDTLRVIFETVAALGPKARRANITIEYVPTVKRQFIIKGDPIRFTHIITILISNAIDAYDSFKVVSPVIVVNADIYGNNLSIKITDYGKGIDKNEREHLFEPFSTTKPDGMGIGLFMALEMTKQHFQGSLTLDPSLDETTFILEIPRSHRNHKIGTSL